MATTARPLALVTGASSGIGYELALECARNGYDLIVAADRSLSAVVGEAQSLGAQVEAVEADLATLEGLQELSQSVRDRPIEALIANAGHGLGRAFLDQDFAEVAHVINTNVTGTLYLIQKLGKPMRERRAGRILIVGSIAGFTPGTYQAVYNGTKAFIDSFSWALRAELKDTGVTVTCSDAGRHRDGVLQARRHDGYEGGDREEDGGGRRRAYRFQSHDGWRGRRGRGLEEQDHGRGRIGDAGHDAGRTAPQAGAAGYGQAVAAH